MSLFDDVTIGWKGVEYTVPSNKVMGLIEVIEDCVTLEDLHGKIPRGRLARAYCSALSYAGCKTATQESVYAKIYELSGDENNILRITQSLMMMMIPPSSLQQELPDASEEDVKKPEPEQGAVGS